MVKTYTVFVRKTVWYTVDVVKTVVVEATVLVMVATSVTA